jgi:phosphomannomutase
MIYLFDVDNTLTPPRSAMDSEFKEFFKQFMTTNRVMLITGSDIDKTNEQLGEDIVDSIEYSFNCSGNNIFHYGKQLTENLWSCPDDLLAFLERKLYDSTYAKFGGHFDDRCGMVNFSTVGRNAPKQERELYFEWDKTSKQRHTITEQINAGWPHIQAVIGGQTSIDIFECGFDKSQILNFLISDDISFFGDSIYPGGNDYSLATAIREKNRGISYNVTDWNQTFTLLKNL